MAIRTDAGSDYLSRSSSLPSITAFTVAMWVMFVVDKNDYTAILTLGNSDHSQIGTEADGTSLCITSDSVASSTVALSLNTWYHIVWVHRSNSDNELWVDGTIRVDGFSMTVGAISDIKLGTYDGGGSFFFNGRIAGLKWWETALSPTEIPQERYTFRPIKRDNLYCFVPILTGSGQRGLDFSGLGHSFTEVGALTDEDGPPIGWGGWVNAYTTIVSASSALTGDGSTGSSFSNSGSGRVDLLGAGSSALNEVNAGAGKLALLGAGSTASIETNTGSGRLTLSGAGSSALQESNTGAGIISLSGAGSAALNESNAGVGQVSLLGGGSSALNESNSGAGIVSLSGAGSSALNESNSSSGLISLRGAGSANLAETNIGNGQTALLGSGSATLNETNSGSGQAGSSLSASGTTSSSLSTSGAGHIDLKGAGSVSISQVDIGSGHLDLYGGGQTSEMLLSSGSGLVGEPAGGFVMARRSYKASGKQFYRPVGKVPYKP